jgi:hypothetical protein
VAAMATVVAAMVAPVEVPAVAVVMAVATTEVVAVGWVRHTLREYSQEPRHQDPRNDPRCNPRASTRRLCRMQPKPCHTLPKQPHGPPPSIVATQASLE